MPAEARQEQVITYTSREVAAPEERDLILLEQEEWGGYCGELTKWGLRNYLMSYFFREGQWLDRDSRQEEVQCCGVGTDETGAKLFSRLSVEIHVYELAPGVVYQLRATVGELGEGRLEEVIERQTVTFEMEREQSLPHPAAEIVYARWLTGPWTTGGVPVAAPPLTVPGRAVRSAIPLFGSVELILRVKRWTHELVVYGDEANPLLESGWTEFVVGLPSGGRPVALAVEPPPGMDHLPESGLDCGQSGRGDSGRIEGPPEDEEPVAQPEDKHIKCEYCELECEDPDEEGEE